MEFLLLLVGFCYVLHKMCAEKGISPVNYLVGFVTGFFIVLLGVAVAIACIYGPNIMNDPDANKKILAFTPFALLFHFLLFIFFRRKIAKVADFHDEDDNHTPNPPTGEKKDLSYFR